MNDAFTACDFLRAETDDRTCYRVEGNLAPRTRSELFRGCWCGFRRRSHSLLKTVGYENASYGHSAHRKRYIEAGFGREDYNSGLKTTAVLRTVRWHVPAYDSQIVRFLTASRVCWVGWWDMQSQQAKSLNPRNGRFPSSSTTFSQDVHRPRTRPTMNQLYISNDFFILRSNIWEPSLL